MKAGNRERGTGNVPMARVSVVCFPSVMDSAPTIHMFPVPCSLFHVP